MAAPVLVIGYGNTLRGDDGAGRRAATLIGERGKGGEFGQCARPLRAIAVHQLLPELAEDIAHAARVVFIDAYATSDAAAPLRVEPIGGAEAASRCAHSGSPAALLALCAQLYGRSPQTWVVGIPAYDFAPGAAISPRTARHIDDAVAWCTAPGDDR